MMSALGWMLTMALAQQGSVPSARETAAAFDPLQNPAAVSMPRTSVFLEGGKEGKVLSGRIAVGLDKLYSGLDLDLTLTGTELDESSGRSRVLQLFEQNPGGNLAVGLTWNSFDVRTYLPEIEQVKRLCRSRQKPQVTAADKKNALDADERYQRAAAEAMKRTEEADALQAAANQALSDPTRQDEARLLTQSAWIMYSEASVAAELAGFERTRVEAGVQPPEKPCAVKEDLTEDELDDLVGFAPPASVIVMLRGDVGAQRTAYFEPQTGTRGSEFKHPWGVRAGLGIFLKPTSLLGLTVGYREARESRAPVQLCVNQPVEGETTVPPTLSCASTIIGAPTWSGTARARLEWRQYLDSIIPGAAWNPSVTWSTRIKERSIHFDDVVWRFDVPVYFHLVSDKDKGLVVGVAYARYAVSDEPVHDLSLFLSGTFSVARF